MPPSATRSTRAFVEELLGPHAFPRISGKDLTFHMSPWADLVPGPLGIPQPPATAPQVTPDLLLVPLLAATLDGVRLGQGGGYYDRTLAALRAKGPVTAVGLAWEVQIADVPAAGGVGPAARHGCDAGTAGRLPQRPLSGCVHGTKLAQTGGHDRPALLPRRFMRRWWCSLPTACRRCRNGSSWLPI